MDDVIDWGRAGERVDEQKGINFEIENQRNESITILMSSKQLLL